MDIAALSTQLSSLKVNNDINIRVADMAMNNTEVQAAQMVEMMQQPQPNVAKLAEPHKGNTIDITL